MNSGANYADFREANKRQARLEHTMLQPDIPSAPCGHAFVQSPLAAEKKRIFFVDLGRRYHT